MPKVHSMMPSKFLKQEDVGRGQLYTIREVKQVEAGKDEDLTMKWSLFFAEVEKPMTLNVTNITILEGLYGDDTDGWIGKQIVVYNDPDVMYAGKKTGGIRVRAPKGSQPVEIDPLPF